MMLPRRRCRENSLRPGPAYISGEYMIDRLWRDLRVDRIYTGSNEVQEIPISHRMRKGDLQAAGKAGRRTRLAFR